MVKLNYYEQKEKLDKLIENWRQHGGHTRTSAALCHIYSCFPATLGEPNCPKIENRF